MSIQFDSSRFMRDTPISPFYSHPPHLPTLFHPDIYSHMTRFDEDLWNSRLAERKIMERYQEDKYFQRISPPKQMSEEIRPAEIDLTTTGPRNQVEDYSRHSPRYYYNSQGEKERESETDYSLKSHSVSPPGLDERLRKSSYYTSSVQSNGIMDKTEHQGAINLTSVRESTESLQNGEILRNGDMTEESQETGQQSPHDQPVAAKRKVKSNSAIETGIGMGGILGQQMAMAAQHGLTAQQLQQFLQQQTTPAINPTQIQQLMQHQSMVMQHQQQQKLQEQVLQELNEQLQMNMLQQSKLMQQPDKVKNSKSQQQLTQLAVQQQQLVQQIQQIQLQQRQFLLACLAQPFVGVSQGMMSPVEIQQLWKEVAAQSGLQDESKAHFNGLNSTRSQTPTSQALPTWTNGVANHLSQHNISGQPSRPQPEEEDDEPKFTTLYRQGLCKWPGCDIQCENYKVFFRHINEEHHLDDRSTAQARVQMQVVSQLEIQLTREKELLQEMMRHLHMKPNDKNSTVAEVQKPRAPVIISTAATEMPTSPQSTSTLSSLSVPSPPKMTSVITSPTKILPSLHMSASAPPTPVSLVSHPISLPIVIPPQLGHTSISKPPTPQSHSMSQPSTPTSIGPMRRRVSDKCNLPISAEIQRNREFYKNTDVRPPFTYASLIRQAIIESQHKQLTLNEIYQWFQNTFSYFRRNEATWKNAVRHNLSLHKCFMRVENVKGAVWTVDEIEFYKRRPQKLGGSMGMREIPSPGSDPSVFGDSLNASLRAAIEQANIHFMNNQNYSNGESSLDGAEDLSMKSNRNDSSESLSKFDFPSREEYHMMMKEEAQDDAYNENENEGHLGDGIHKDEDMIDSEIDSISQEMIEVKTEDQTSVHSPKDTSHVPTNHEIFSSLLQKAQDSMSATSSHIAS
ncbi:FOXP2_4 [Mytilus coruscus]|uniref:FOXP2_4 n=1 Tax=Mytilus coruscus TaxID=42192 RepID=A0A6J8EGY6_MYTCO|nr:FOXP2_4 [Mytilus coruscus]